MEAFLQSYGLWVLLAVVFVAMHWLGMGCGRGHDHGSGSRRAGREGGAGDAEHERERPVGSGHQGRGCH
ncbi:MAG: hypothetical protein HY002_10980 [Candidatus Rokubacteria bacterium]|nr:hypothetical protein [Candidatus Rokubacteria bacterium]